MQKLFHKIGTIDDWDRAIEECSFSTFFHTKEWFYIWCKCPQQKITVHHFEINGQKIIIPVLWSWFNLVLKIAQNSPCGTYGLYLSIKPIDNLILLRIIDNLLKFYDKVYLTGNPYINLKNNEIDADDSTQIISLELPLELIRKAMSNSQIIRSINKGEKALLETKQINEKEVNHFFKIYQKRRSEWEMPSNNYLLEDFMTLFETKNVEFWGVFKDNNLIAGGIFFLHKRIVISWLPVADSTYFMYSPLKFLNYKLIFLFKKRGFKIYDFNPSGGHIGTEFFKSNFGTKKIIFRNNKYHSSRYQKLSWIKSNFVKLLKI